MASSSNNHVFVLVPGFGGFDSLGSVTYYCGTTRVLSDHGRHSVLYFPNRPAAAVNTRAKLLRTWLHHQRLHDRIAPDAHLHLIGHSTGGLDLRHLLVKLAGGSRDDRALLVRVSSVQFLSTPHEGSWIARRVSPSAVRLIARLIRESVGLTDVVPARRLAGLLDLLRSATRDGNEALTWTDALIDALYLGVEPGSLDERSRAIAEQNLAQLLRWLSSLANDEDALTDLHPDRCRQWAQDNLELERRVLRVGSPVPLPVRSIVTSAPTRAHTLPLDNLFTLVHALSRGPEDQSGPRRRVEYLLKPGSTELLAPGMNDGLVEGVSQVWPSAEHSRLVTADHGDIIGHFGTASRPCRDDQVTEPWTRSGRSYDLLPSGAHFSQEKFDEVWSDVREFALGCEL